MESRMTGAAPLVLHGIASCDTCRKARRWLDAKGLAYRVHDLRDDGVTIAMLERWRGRIGWQQLLNTRSLTWRRLPEVDRLDVTPDRAIRLMLEHPTLIRRPVLEHGDLLATGFAPAQYEKLLDGFSG